MYVIEVLPIARGIRSEKLSYFTEASINVGMLVHVPVRSRKVPAVVLSVVEARHIKEGIRKSSYKLKKLDKSTGKQILPSWFMEAGKYIARYYMGTTGQVLFQFAPKMFFEDKDIIDKISLNDEIKINSPDKNINSLPRWDGKVLYSLPDIERIEAYKNRIREAFAANKSVYIFSPTIFDVEFLANTLQKGINDRVVMLHSGLTRIEQKKALIYALSLKKPILLVATPSFAAIPRNDIGLFIIDKEASSLYKTRVCPYLSIPHFLQMCAKYGNFPLILGDAFIRIESVYEVNQDYVNSNSDLRYRLSGGGEVSVVDISKERKKVAFQILSKEVKENISHTLGLNKNVLIYSTRKGLAPYTLCRDCGKVLTCGVCGSSLALIEGAGKKREYRCNICITNLQSNKTCTNCGSWNLVPLGIGIEKIEEELKNLYPSTPLTRIDATLKTQKEAIKRIHNYFNIGGGILLTTEMGLLYLQNKVYMTCAASIDSLFAVPDYRMRSRILNLLIRLRYMAENRCIIQTRNPDDYAITSVKDGNLTNFYREDLALREMLKLPPFTVIIKITKEGFLEETINEFKKIQNDLGIYEMEIYQGHTKTSRGKLLTHGLIRIKIREYPNPILSNYFDALPRGFTINVDPSGLF